jgi:ABC-type polysaccharide/polyol phosphate export permease
LHDLREIVTDFWVYRDLLVQLTLRDVKIRYKQSVMGFAWAVLMPLLIVLAGIVVRVAMSYLSGSELETDALTGIAVKSLPWAFFVGAVGFANSSLVSNTNMVTKVYFPREVLPLSATLAQAFDTLVAAAALLVVLPFLGVGPSPALLWVAPIAVMLFAQTVAAALVLSCANLFFRDVKYLVQVLITFGIFLTPVFFEPTMFPPEGALALMLNPLSPLLEGLRLAVVEGHHLTQPLLVDAPGAGEAVLAWAPWYLAYAAVWAVGGLIVAALAFHRLEHLFAEYV